MKRLICIVAILILTFQLAVAQSIRQSATQKHNKESSSVQPAAAGNPVTGSGTVGRLSKWTGSDGSNSFTLGNSIIFEDKFGKVGIGTVTPTSTLTVRGMIETTLGGYKFPDGTVQTTAGLASVFHDATLKGNGTSASPLGVAVPLTLQGSQTGVGSPILQVTNTGNNGSAINGFAGNGDGTPGGNGVTGLGGNSNSGEGGAGIIGAGGTTDSGPAGTGIVGFGGNTVSGVPGPGVQAFGGSSANRRAGDGVVATGGTTNSNNNQARAGNGVVATGGDQTGQGIAPSAGHGVEATGGLSKENNGGDGVRAKGGDSVNQSPGVGVRATGGTRPDDSIGGDGVDATGGNGNNAGHGIRAFGGRASGAGNTAGNGIVAFAGNANASATPGRAGVFVGDVLIEGGLNVTGTKNFKIDHPLDPENKYLVHAAIESSEVLNIYSGNITTDASGEAIVTLPEWFEVLNKDLRYQLTVVGTFAQAIVSEEIKDNRFTIKTNSPQVKVSWQVTGVRSDAVMLKHPFKAEVVKFERERGTYLSPEAYGQPEEKGVEWIRHPEIMQRLRQQRLEAEQAQKHGKPNNR
jgi:trimeric autotransporter adhesin